MKAVYENLCPVCHNSLTYEEIKDHKCLRKNAPLHISYEVKELDEFEKFFGKQLRALQRLWAKRVLRHESFAIEAPTGTGKSSFGITMAEFLALRGNRCYIIVPTTNLVKQTYGHVRDKHKCIAFHKDLQDKEEILKRIKKGDFNLLITTAAFLTKHYGELRGKSFDYIFVDDLDAVLNASRNLYKIIELLGFDKHEMRKSQNELERLRREKGILVIATATSKPGKSTQILRQVLGIDASSSKHALRNISDYFIKASFLSSAFIK